MATKIKRSLFIGLGGTGMSTLLSTKRFFIETYGEVPPMIGFLGVDTDENFYTKSLPSKKGNITLTPGELCKIQVFQPMDIYRREPEMYDWLPQKNVKALLSLTQGAGQIRSNGRFAFCLNYKKIEQAFNSKLVNITNAKIIDNAKYELLSSAIEIHLVYSIGGGTGCGTFIDFAYLIKEHAPDARTSAYAVLPGVFEAFMHGPSVKNVKPNAYGALLDLDYLMHFLDHNNPYTFKYLDHELKVMTPPLQSLYVVDNKNENGDTYTHIDQITEMLGLALVTSSGEFSNSNASPLDNVEKHIATRAMEIKNKEAYACGMGMSMILFDGEQLAKLYSIKAARRLIERMTNTSISNDINSLANSWIDSPEVSIREDKGQDNVIDFILSKSPSVKFTNSSISSNTNPVVDVNNYIEETAKPKKDSVDIRIDQLLIKTRGELRTSIVKILNSENGVGTSINFLNEVERQIDIFMKEMNDEYKEWQTKDSNNDTRVKNAIEDIKSAVSLSIFSIGRRARILDSEDDLVNQVNSKAISIREIIRRESALKYFTGLKNTIQTEKSLIVNFNNSLKTVNSRLSQRINHLQIIGEQQHAFVLDLHKEYSKKIEVDNNTLGVDTFAQSVLSDSKIYGLLDKTPGEIQNVLLEYTDSLPETINYKELSINSILKDLNNEEYESLIKKALAKSLPLISFDYKGYPAPELHEAFIIGVPDKNNTVIVGGNNKSNENKEFEELSENIENSLPPISDFVGGSDNIEIVSTGSKDKIIIYRLKMAVPVFALGGIKKYKEQYNQATIDCHFDNSIFERIKNEKFSIMPKDSSDDDVIGLWVRGIIYGFITNENGIYYLKTRNKTLTNVLSDYKFKLNLEYHRREQAFARFKEIINLVREELSNNIEKLISEKGSAINDELRKNVKAEDNYISIDMAKIGQPKEWISLQGQKEIERLVLEETEYIEKSF